MPSFRASGCVVTGRGALTPAGEGVHALLALVGAGRHALGRPSNVGDPVILDAVVGEVDGFLDSPRPRLVEFARSAAGQALAEAGLRADELAACDLVLGTGAGSRSPFDWQTAGREPPPGAQTDWAEQFASVAQAIRGEFGMGGQVVVINTACSSGAHALLHAHQLIRTGRSRRVLCIGADEFWAGLFWSFKMMGAVSAAACDPYRSSAGTTLAEGAGAVVLEHPEEASRREVHVYGSLVGVGASADAYHPARPDPTGTGAELAVERAIRSVVGGAPRIAFVYGHGTGTAANDAMEATFHQRCFPSVPLIGSKGLHGHSFGASGIVEFIVAMAILAEEVTPSSTCFSPDFGQELEFASQRRLAIKTSFAMGGLNTAVVVSDGPPVQESTVLMPTVASVGELTADGVGWLESHRLDLVTVVDKLIEGNRADAVMRHLDDYSSDCVISPRRWSQLDLLGKLVLAGAATLLKGIWRGELDEVGIAYATRQGPILSWAAVTDAMRSGRPVNPKLLPRLSHHAPVMSVCETLGLRGPAAAFVSGPEAGRHAVEHAVMLLETGAANAMLVVEADEYTGPQSEHARDVRRFGIEPDADLFAPVHGAVGEPRAHPSATCLLLTRQVRSEDDVASNAACLTLPSRSGESIRRLAVELSLQRYRAGSA